MARTYPGPTTRPLLAALLAALALGCDPVPDLYVVDASVDTGATGEAATGDDGGGNADDGDAGDDGPDEGPPPCTGVSCPGCPPNPGACCANDVPCFGANCAVDCAACATCQGICCSKSGGPPTCRKDGGKCPP